MQTPSWILALFPLLAGCGRISTLEARPPITPEAWLQSMPEVTLPGDVLLTQPSSSILVFSLAALSILVGIGFLVSQRGQHARLWWGIAMVCSGIGAALAGVSFQAFGYELKCLGYETCRFTDGFEIWYMIFQVIGTNAMLIGVASQFLGGAWVSRTQIFGAIYAGLYMLTVAIGAWMPERDLLTFTNNGAGARPSVGAHDGDQPWGLDLAAGLHRPPLRDHVAALRHLHGRLLGRRHAMRDPRAQQHLRAAAVRGDLAVVQRVVLGQRRASHHLVRVDGLHRARAHATRQGPWNGAVDGEDRLVLNP